MGDARPTRRDRSTTRSVLRCRPLGPASGRRCGQLCRRRQETEVLSALVGPGLVGRGHQRLARPRCTPCWPGGITAASAGRTSPHEPRPRAPGHLSRLGPPASAGRWSLVAPLLLPTPTPTEAAHAQALQLLERHGVVTREAVLAEGVVGGYASVYGVLKVLEERGRARRGYFVSGLGAAQFALPGAVDRLRSEREPEPDDPVPVLAATDPAQPSGHTGVAGGSPPSGRVACDRVGVVVSAGGVPLVWSSGASTILSRSRTRHPTRGGQWRWPTSQARVRAQRRGAQGRRRAGVRRHRRRTPRGLLDGYRGLVLRAV